MRSVRERLIVIIVVWQARARVREQRRRGSTDGCSVSRDPRFGIGGYVWIRLWTVSVFRGLRTVTSLERCRVARRVRIRQQDRWRTATVCVDCRVLPVNGHSLPARGVCFVCACSDKVFDVIVAVVL